MNKFLAFSLSIVSLILGLGIGYGLSPAYSTLANEGHLEDLDKADKFVDLRYINAMIAHHKSAMELASEVKDKTKRSEIRNLAEEILKNEPAAIDELYAWKENWFNDKQIIQPSIVSNLGSADENLDLRFLNALIAHHEEGIVMAKSIRSKSNRSEILDNSYAVEKFLKGGIEMFSTWRTDWYDINK